MNLTTNAVCDVELELEIHWRGNPVGITVSAICSLQQERREEKASCGCLMALCWLLLIPDGKIDLPVLSTFEKIWSGTV